MAASLIEKLAKIRRMTEFQEKTKKGFNYTYVPDHQILAQITAGLYKHKVDVYPSITPGTLQVMPIHYTKVKYDKKGTRLEEEINEILVQADMTFEWVNLEDPNDRMTTSWALVGQQSDASQAIGSALTYCMRYYMLKFFKVSTTNDDPDLLRQDQTDAYVKAIIEEVDGIAKTNSTDENRDAYVALVKSIVHDDKGSPSANYFKVRDVNEAERLLRATIEFFNVTEE